MLKSIHTQPNSTLISLFIPGFPGGYRDRDLFWDMRALGSDIYTIVYPGTDGVQGILSPETVQKSVEEAVTQLQKMDKKIALFAYSFGTLPVITASFAPLNIIGLFLFSPIIDLKYCLTHSFVGELAQLKGNEQFCVDVPSFFSSDASLDAAWQSYALRLGRWLKLGIPTIYAIGLQDSSVRQGKISSLLQQYLVSQHANAYYIYTCDGGHKLDSIYETGGVLYDLICPLAL